MIDLVMAPAGAGKFRAVVGSMAITKPARQPLFDGARALLALGHDPAEVVAARHAGSDTIAMHGTLGDLARWTIEERDQGGMRRALWKPREMADSSFAQAPETAEGDDGGHPAHAAPPALERAA